MSFYIANQEDDSEIRDLLSRNPLPGLIKLGFETNPGFFRSLAIHGYRHEVMVSGDHEGKINGLAVRSLQKVYISGKQENVGYLSNLRVDKTSRRQGILSKGMKFIKKINEKNPIGIQYTYLVDKNKNAKKIFLSNKKNFPHFYDLGKVKTYIIFLNPVKNEKKVFKISEANNKEFQSVSEFAKAEGIKKNFYPVFSEDDFKRKDGSFPGNFFVARNKKEILGILSVWDQANYRQTVAKKYNFPINLFRIFYDYYAMATGKKRFPGLNERFSYLYLGHILARKGYENALKECIDAVLKKYSNGKYHYCVLSLHEKDELNRIVKRYRHISYGSSIYLVSWKKQDKVFNMLRNNNIHIEISRA